MRRPGPATVRAPLPLTPAYSISKAAAFSLTQSLRALLAGRGVRVHAVLTGPTVDVPEGPAVSAAIPPKPAGLYQQAARQEAQNPQERTRQGDKTR